MRPNRRKLKKSEEIKISVLRGAESVLGRGTKIFGTEKRPSKKKSRDEFRRETKYLLG